MKITVTLTYSNYIELEVDDNLSKVELKRLGLEQLKKYEKDYSHLDFVDGTVTRSDDSSGDCLAEF